MTWIKSKEGTIYDIAYVQQFADCNERYQDELIKITSR